MKINTITFKEGKAYGTWMPELGTCNPEPVTDCIKSNPKCICKKEIDQARANALPIHEESVERVKKLCYLSEHKGWEEIGWSVKNKDYSIQEVEMEVENKCQHNGIHNSACEYRKVLVLAEKKIVDFSKFIGHPLFKQSVERENKLSAIEEIKQNMPKGETSINNILRDSKRLDWIEKLMTDDNDYCEIYFAGLRNFSGKATAYQIESNPKKFETINAKDIREVIDLAMGEKQSIPVKEESQEELWDEAWQLAYNEGSLAASEKFHITRKPN